MIKVSHERKRLFLGLETVPSMSASRPCPLAMVVVGGQCRGLADSGVFEDAFAN